MIKLVKELYHWYDILSKAPNMVCCLEQVGVSMQVSSEQQNPSKSPDTAGMKNGTPITTPSDIRDAEATVSGNGADGFGRKHRGFATVNTLCAALAVAAAIS